MKRAITALFFPERRAAVARQAIVIALSAAGGQQVPGNPAEHREPGIADGS